MEYNQDNKIIFKTSMLRLSLCHYSDAYIRVKGAITVAQTTIAATNDANKKIIFKNYAPFINYINRINNTQVNDAHDIENI